MTFTEDDFAEPKPKFSEADFVEDSGQSRPSSALSAFMQGGGKAMGQTVAGSVRLDFPDSNLLPGDFPPLPINEPSRQAFVDETSKIKAWMTRTPEEREARIQANPIYNAGVEIAKGAEEAFPTNPKFRGEFWADTIPSSAGAMVPTIASAIAGGPVLGAGQYGLSAGQSEAQAAIDSGREDQADKAFLLNLGIGAASELLLGVPANIMRYVRAARNTGVDKKIVKETILKEIGKGALREAGQETIEQAGSNLAARNTYDPNRPITEGLPQAAAAGLLLGGAVSGGATAVGRFSRPPIDIEAKVEDAGKTPGRRAIDAIANLNRFQTQEQNENTPANVEETKAENVVTPPKIEAKAPDADVLKFAGEIGFTVRGKNNGAAVAQIPPERLAAMPPEEQAMYAEIARQQGGQYDLTDTRSDSPTKGFTFYVPEKSTPEQMREIFKTKLATIQSASPVNPSEAASPAPAPVFSGTPSKVEQPGAAAVVAEVKHPLEGLKDGDSIRVGKIEGVLRIEVKKDRADLRIETKGGSRFPIANPEQIQRLENKAADVTQPPTQQPESAGAASLTTSEPSRTEAARSNVTTDVTDAIPKQLSNETPEQTLNGAKRVKVRVPTGATMLRVTDTKGRKMVEPVKSVSKGDNIFFDSGVSKVEAGTIGRDKKFIPVDGRVVVEKVSKPALKTGIEGEANDDGSRVQGTPQEVRPGLEAENQNQEVQAGGTKATLGESARMAKDLEGSGEVLRGTGNEIATAFTRSKAKAGRIRATLRSKMGRVGRIRSRSEEQASKVSGKTRVFIEEDSKAAGDGQRQSVDILAHAILFGDSQAAETSGAGQPIRIQQARDLLSRLARNLTGQKFVFIKGDEKQSLAEYQPTTGAIVFNISKFSRFDSEALLAVAIEEVLHATSERVARPGEIAAVWRSLSKEDQATVREFYDRKGRLGELTEHQLGSEYIRIILQDRLTGTTSELSGNISTETKSFLERLLTAIKEIFGAASSNDIARQVIERIEGAINGDAPIEQNIFKSSGDSLRTGIDSGEESESKKQQTFGAKIGESQDVENIREIQASLVENGYGVGDTVTPENTAQAWRLFVGFVDPNTRTDWINQLRRVVPKEMAPGILQSELWKYAIRLASQGNPALFRAMAQNSNHFIMGTGDAFRSTFGRGLRALKLGSEFTTWKNELERSKEQRKAIAKQLGVAHDLIDLLVDNLNGAKPDTAPIVTTVSQTPLPGGQTVQQVLDAGDAPVQTPAQIDSEIQREQASRANTTAAEFLRRLELDYAGVDWLRPNSPARTTVQTILRDHYGSESPILPVQGNTNRIIQELAARFETEVGVSPDIARQLALAAEVKRQTDWTNARARAVERAASSGSLRSLIEDILASPYLAQTDPDWIKTTAERWFMSNGLSQEQAKGAAAILDREFRQKLYEAQAKIAERMLEKAKPQNTKSFLEALRAGLFDPDKPWVERYAEKAGMRSPTKEQFQRLATLELSLHDNNLTAPERAQVVEEMMGIYLHLKLPPPLISRIASNFVVTSLTGLRTGTVNIFAPIVRLLTETTLRTATRPQDTLRNLKTLLGAYGLHGPLWRRLQFSLTKDAYTFINNEYEQSTNEMRRIWETALEDMKSGSKWRQARGALKTLWGSQQFYMRLLNALDQANAIAEREVQMVNYGSAAFREAGLGSSHVTALVQAVSRLKRAAYDDAINRRNLTPADARVHSDEIAFEELERFIAAEIGGEKGVSKAAEARDAAEKDAYSAIGRLSPDTAETDEGGIGSRVFYHTLLEISNLFRRGKGVEPILGVSLLGYVSIPVRTARYIAWNSPYGLLRLGIHHFRKNKGLESQWKQSLATEAQEKHRLKMALAGTAALATLTALGFKLLKSSADDDAGDDEMAMYVTGRGPKNKALKDEWEKSGFRENSLILFYNKKPHAIPLTRLGEPLAHLVFPNAARDDYDWRKKEAEAAGKEFDENWAETTGYSMGTYIGLLGQRGVFQNISYWAKLGSGEGGTQKIVADLGSKTVANAILPWMGMQRGLIGIAEGKLDKSSIQSVIGANLGIIGVGLQKPAINRYGDKLGNRTWYGIVGDTGVPMAFQVENTPENEKFYRTLAQKGISPPELQRRVIENRYGELTDNQFQDFGQKSGNLLKQTIQKNLSAIEKMSPEQADKFITNAAQQADRIAANALALKVQPKKAAAAPATSTGETSAAIPAPSRAAAPPAASPSRPASSGSTSRAPSGRIRSSLASYKVPRLRKSSGRIRSMFSRGFKKMRFKSGRIRSRMGKPRRSRIRYAI